MAKREINTEQLLKNADDVLASPDGKRVMQNLIRRTQRRQKLLEEKHEEFEKLTNEKFYALVLKQIELHDTTWRDKCLKKGIETKPKKELQLIISVVELYGRDIVPQTWEMFAKYYKSYKGLRIIRFDGQGSFYKIYKFNKLLLQT